VSLAAEGRDAAASPADSAAAQALFEQGRQLMAAGQAEAACPRFEESERLEAGIGTQFNLADCYEAVGKVASAYALFLEVAARAKELGQERRESVARERAEAVKTILPKLVIVVEAEQPMLSVERDGSAVNSPQWGVEIPIDPGTHRIQASAPGFVPWSTEVDVSRAPVVHTVRVPRLGALTERSFFSSTSRTVGLVTLGASVVALGVSGGFALDAHAKDADSKRAGCAHHTCPNDGALKLRHAALAAGDRATWAMGIGLAGLAASAVLFFALPEPDGPESGVALHPVPSLGDGGAGVGLAGRF